MLLLEDFLAVLHVIPLLILVLLMGLELGVALIQAYVFTILTCIYLNEAINLHYKCSIKFKYTMLLWIY